MFTTAQMQCDIAIAITNTSSPAYHVYTEEMQQVKQGNYSAVRVPVYIPTVLVKTFHPRTLGQLAYADLIKAVW